MSPDVPWVTPDLIMFNIIGIRLKIISVLIDDLVNVL